MKDKFEIIKQGRTALQEANDRAREIAETGEEQKPRCSFTPSPVSQMNNLGFCWTAPSSRNQEQYFSELEKTRLQLQIVSMPKRIGEWNPYYLGLKYNGERR